MRPRFRTRRRLGVSSCLSLTSSNRLRMRRLVSGECGGFGSSRFKFGGFRLGACGVGGRDGCCGGVRGGRRTKGKIGGSPGSSLDPSDGST